MAKCSADVFPEKNFLRPIYLVSLLATVGVKAGASETATLDGLEVSPEITAALEIL
ncbi:MAG: hypothetical protein ACI8XO_001227 [Verrucomicrobiales bacterium]|jgi:hypothetical protein